VLACQILKVTKEYENIAVGERIDREIINELFLVIPLRVVKDRVLLGFIETGPIKKAVLLLTVRGREGDIN